MITNKILSRGSTVEYFSKLIFRNIFNLIHKKRKMSGIEVSKNNKEYQSNQYINDFKKFIPKLTQELHKGECGRICVIGGSSEYTGAPYFSAISALKLGADLVYVICCRDAAQVIKSYSPELIVYPFLDDEQVVEKVVSCLDKAHSIVIGPGLGREPGIFAKVEAIIKYCNSTHTRPPLIIDADGLFLVTQKTELVQQYQGPVVLTPNAVEYSRLCQKLSLNGSDVAKVAQIMNVVLLKKGDTDIICNGIKQNFLKLPEKTITVKCHELGSHRRCGGQGDILCGCVAVFVAWFMNKQYKNNDPNSEFQSFDKSGIVNSLEKELFYKERFYGFSLACFAACCVTRHCSYLTFEKYGRSMTASDMISFIHTSFGDLFGKEFSLSSN